MREQPDPQHIVELTAAERTTLYKWLEFPNGSLRMGSSGRVVFERVEGGGILVRTDPYPGQ